MLGIVIIAVALALFTGSPIENPVPRFFITLPIDFDQSNAEAGHVTKNINPFRRIDRSRGQVPSNGAGGSLRDSKERVGNWENQDSMMREGNQERFPMV